MAWLNLNRQNRDFKANRARHEEATLKRLIQVFSSRNGVEGANPEDVDAPPQKPVARNQWRVTSSASIRVPWVGVSGRPLCVALSD